MTPWCRASLGRHYGIQRDAKRLLCLFDLLPYQLRDDDAAVESLAIHRLSTNRMSQLGQMNADLVRAPRFQPARDQAVSPQILQNLYMGSSRLAEAELP